MYGQHWRDAHRDLLWALDRHPKDKPLNIGELCALRRGLSLIGAARLVNSWGGDFVFGAARAPLQDLDIDHRVRDWLATVSTPVRALWSMTTRGALENLPS